MTECNMSPALLRVLIVLCIMAAFLVEYIGGQSCQLSTSIACSSFVDVGTPIFLPANSTLATAEHIVNSQSNLINYKLIPEPCRSNILRLLCSTWLRPCATDGNGTFIPVPAQPCLDVCTEYEAACIGHLTVTLGTGAYYPPGYSPPLNCSQPIFDSLAGNVSLYQASNYSYEYHGMNLSIPCSASKPFTIPVPVICQAPLVASPETGFCAFSCPLPSLSDQQYTNVKVMQGVLGWISWVVTAILIIAMAVYPRTRDFPRNLIIMTAGAANIAAGGIILPTYAGYENTWCGGGAYASPPGTLQGYDSLGLPVITFQLDESTLSFGSPLCTFQGAIIQFGFLAAVFWWVIIAFNMCLELYLGQHLSLDKSIGKWVRFGIYQCYGWGIPFILMVIPAAAGQIKFVPEGTYCFVTGADNNAWSLTFWFLPVGVSLLMGVTLFFVALGKITHLFITLRKFKKLLMLYLRLFLFICLYLILFVFIFAYTIQFTSDESAIDNMYANYYTCLIEAGGDACTLDSSLTNYNLIMLKAWAISSLGLLLFLLFISWDVSRFWFFLLRSFVLAIIRRSPDEVVSVAKMVMYKSHSTMSLRSSSSLKVSYDSTAADPTDDKEEDGEEDEMETVNTNKEDEAREVQSSSSSSEQD